MKKCKTTSLCCLTSAGQEVRAGLVMEFCFVQLERCHHCHALMFTLIWITETFSCEYKKLLAIAVLWMWIGVFHVKPVPDPEQNGGEGGGGGGWVSKKIFPPFGHQFGLKISGWGPSRGSAIVNSQHFSAFFGQPSLRRRRNPPQVSTVCKATPKSLFWIPTGLTNYRMYVSNLPSSWLANHGAFVNPDSQVGNQSNNGLN